MAVPPHPHNLVDSLMANSETTSYKICLPRSPLFQYKNRMLNTFIFLFLAHFRFLIRMPLNRWRDCTVCNKGSYESVDISAHAMIYFE